MSGAGFSDGSLSTDLWITMWGVPGGVPEKEITSTRLSTGVEDEAPPVRQQPGLDVAADVRPDVGERLESHDR